MKKRLRTYLFGVIVVCCCYTAVQAQDTLRLPAAEVVALRGAAAATGLRTDSPDSLLLAQSTQLTLAELLPRNGVYLKSYGGGGLASIGIRGASASQTPVIWNGINLQSSSNGQNDFSLLPVFLFDKLTVQPGSTSAAWGSGAIGGAVLLSSSVHPGEKLFGVRTAAQAGSFGENGQAVQVLAQRTNTAVSVRGVRQRVLNNFPYTNYTLPGSPEQKLSHAGTFMQAATADLAWVPKRSSNQRFGAHVWLQENNRDLPPTLLQTESFSNQYDRSARFLLTHLSSMRGGKLLSNSRAAFIRDELIYTSGYIGDSISHTQAFTQITETEWKWTGEKGLSFNAGINNTFAQTEVTRFLSKRSQNRTSIFLLTEVTRFSNWRIAAQFRTEQVNGKLIQPVGSLGAEFMLSKMFSLLGNVSRNYRLPTFNDLYWQPGGNPDLRPEKSWNAEGTLRSVVHSGAFNLGYAFTGFARLVTDWIQWVPQGNVWSPRNVLEVWNRGGEVRLDAAYSFRKFNFSINSGYDYVRSVSLRSLYPNDNSVGKQLIYTPAHRAFGVFSIRRKNTYITYTHQFTSYRFTSTDHTTYLPAYQLAQLTIGTRINRKTFSAESFIRINNLYNEVWEAVALRPVQLRSIQIGLRIDFISKSSH
jgi:vitamin B12 transporter